MQPAQSLQAHDPRIVGTLIGDIVRDPGAQTKYGLFFEALSERFPVIEVYDATLQGTARLLNALRVAHPDRQRWRERFRQNVPAFRARSRQAAAHLRALRGRADLVLQVNVLFDARWNNMPLPSMIYTDYTACLSARRPEGGRSPFTPGQRAQWIALERQAFERATHIFTRSQVVRTSILADYGIAPERVSAVGGGVNFATLPEIEARRNAHPPTALFIGKELYRKGGDLLLHAFARVREQLPAARLLLVTGDAIPSSLPTAGVEVIAPTWDRNVIAALYRRADLFVLPSRLETWGDVLLEAMAYGIPCIGVAGEAMEEIIDDGATGAIVPAGDVEALAGAMTRLLSDSSMRWRWGDAARQRIEAAFTWRRVVERMAPIIEGM